MLHWNRMTKYPSTPAVHGGCYDAHHIATVVEQLRTVTDVMFDKSITLQQRIQVHCFWLFFVLSQRQARLLCMRCEWWLVGTHCRRSIILALKQTPSAASKTMSSLARPHSFTAILIRNKYVVNKTVNFRSVCLSVCCRYVVSIEIGRHRCTRMGAVRTATRRQFWLRTALSRRRRVSDAICTVWH